jgi:hypothetical protein
MSRSLLGALIDRSPVPYTARRATSPAFGQESGGFNQTRALASMSSVGTLFQIVSRISQSVAMIMSASLYLNNAFMACSGQMALAKQH